MLRPLVSRVGAKWAMILCLVLFAAASGSLGFLEADVPGGPNDRFNVMLAVGAVAVIGIPVAGLLVLPHVLISQLIDRDERHTGANRSAMYFGIQGLLTKWIYGISLWVFTYVLSRFGHSPEEPLGVLMLGPAAGLACLVAIGLFALYPERRVLSEGHR